MATLLLKIIPLACIACALAYAAAVGLQLRRTGFASGLGAASLFAGLSLGRLLDRADWLPRVFSDWVDYRTPAAYVASSRPEPYLAVLSVELALQFVVAAAICIVGVALIRRDILGRTEGGGPGVRKGPIAALFVLGVAMAAHAKLAVVAAYLLARAHII